MMNIQPIKNENIYRDTLKEIEGLIAFSELNIKMVSQFFWSNYPNINKINNKNYANTRTLLHSTF